jgi:hypothetical protein
MSRLNKLPVCAGLAFLLSPHSNNHSLTGFIEFEIDRLRAAGHPDPEKLAVWTSRSDPGADHDILSVAADGKPLWIEVKSTTGRKAGSIGHERSSRRRYARATIMSCGVSTKRIRNLRQ